MLTTPPVLAYPDHTRPFSLTTDASGTAIGYILGQRDKNGKDRVIAYGGRSLNKHERKYPISEREGLAIIEGIKTFHVYLAGRPFKIFTDHAALKWLQNVKQSTGRLARWAVLLQGYSYEILFKAGKKNEVADALSRRPYPDTAVPMEDPEDIIPSPDVQCFTPVKEEKSMQATFFYADHQHPFRKTIETETICPVDITSIGDLQKGCPDFKDLYNYFVDRDLPEDKKCRDRLLKIFMYFLMVSFTTITNQDPKGHVIQTTTSNNWQYPVISEKMLYGHTMIVLQEVHILDLNVHTVPSSQNIIGQLCIKI